MNEVKVTRDGLGHLHGVLLERPFTRTKVSLWKIPHHNSDPEYNLKIGRYNKARINNAFTVDEVEVDEPKSELTLRGLELNALVSFLCSDFAALKDGVKRFISIDDSFTKDNVDYLKSLFSHPEKVSLVNLLSSNDVIPADILVAVGHIKRIKAIEEFEKMLAEDLVEHKWQKWFEENSWVLGTDFVRVLDERRIDTDNISDLLVEAYDGFLDIIELKRPQGNLKFWAEQKDHGNYVPHSDLVKAITQSAHYIYEVEREANSNKFRERVGGIKTIKPRCVLIFGRSYDWNEEQKECYRILNSNYHNLTILTYDHILERGKRILSHSKPSR